LPGLEASAVAAAPSTTATTVASNIVFLSMPLTFL
jgi:hypothetical protein